MATYRKTGNGASLHRTEPTALADLIPVILKVMRLNSGMREQIVLSAWDKVTGAAPYTLTKYVKGDVLFCSISSSVMRSQLFFQKDDILKAINKELETELFAGTPPSGRKPIKSLVLK